MIIHKGAILFVRFAIILFRFFRTLRGRRRIPTTISQMALFVTGLRHPVTRSHHETGRLESRRCLRNGWERFHLFVSIVIVILIIIIVVSHHNTAR